MKEIVLIIGGCRSGKSRYALEMAGRFGERKKIFIATCVPRDAEMRERVRRHQAERDQSWTAIEAAIDLPAAVSDNSCKGYLLIVDCLTLWIANLLLETEDFQDIEEHVRRLIRSLESAQCPVLLVTNEVGTGIVPENRLARQFRDTAGLVNQKVASGSDRVVWMVAGIPVAIK